MGGPCFRCQFVGRTARSDVAGGLTPSSFVAYVRPKQTAIAPGKGLNIGSEPGDFRLEVPVDDSDFSTLFNSRVQKRNSLYPRKEQTTIEP